MADPKDGAQPSPDPQDPTIVAGSQPNVGGPDDVTRGWQVPPPQHPGGGLGQPPQPPPGYGSDQPTQVQPPTSGWAAPGSQPNYGPPAPAQSGPPTGYGPPPPQYPPTQHWAPTGQQPPGYPAPPPSGPAGGYQGAPQWGPQQGWGPPPTQNFGAGNFGGPPNQPPIPGQQWSSGDGGGKRGLGTILAILGIVVVLIGAGVGVAGWKLGWFSSSAAPTMLAVDDLGDDPFDRDYGKVRALEPGKLTDFREAGSVEPHDGEVEGTARGLYGGSLDTLTCDGGGIIDYLKANDGKREAFASVVGVRENEVEDYILSLTSVVLLRDTWVTNHGFADGKATAFQAVLQAGTAVLVDKTGVPRVRCACGNPLAPPETGDADPADADAPWDDYSSAEVVQVTGGQNQTKFDIVNLANGQITSTPAGIFKLDLKGTWTAYASWNPDPTVTLKIDSAVRLDGTITYGSGANPDDCVENFVERRREGNVVYIDATAINERDGCDGYSATMTVVDKKMTMQVTAGEADPLEFEKTSG